MRPGIGNQSWYALVARRHRIPAQPTHQLMKHVRGGGHRRRRCDDDERTSARRCNRRLTYELRSLSPARQLECGAHHHQRRAYDYIADPAVRLQAVGWRFAVLCAGSIRRPRRPPPIYGVPASARPQARSCARGTLVESPVGASPRGATSTTLRSRSSTRVLTMVQAYRSQAGSRYRDQIHRSILLTEASAFDSSVEGCRHERCGHRVARSSRVCRHCGRARWTMNVGGERH